MFCRRKSCDARNYFFAGALFIAGFAVVLDTDFTIILEAGRFAVAAIGLADLVIFLVTFVVCLTIFFAAGLVEVFFAIFVVVVFDAGLIIGLAEVTGAARAMPPTVRALVSAKIRAKCFIGNPFRVSPLRAPLPKIICKSQRM